MLDESIKTVYTYDYDLLAFVKLMNDLGVKDYFKDVNKKRLYFVNIRSRKKSGKRTESGNNKGLAVRKSYYLGIYGRLEGEVHTHGKFYDKNSEKFSEGFPSDIYAAEWISDNVSKNFTSYLITPRAQFKKHQPSQSMIAIAIDPTLYANEDIGYRLYRDKNATNQND